MKQKLVLVICVLVLTLVVAKPSLYFSGDSARSVGNDQDNPFNPDLFKQINASVTASLEDFDPASCPVGTTTTLTTITQCQKLTAFAIAMAAVSCHARASVTCPDGRVAWGEGWGSAFSVQAAWNEMCLCLSQERQDPNNILCGLECRDALVARAVGERKPICVKKDDPLNARSVVSSDLETKSYVFWNTFYPVDVLNVFNPFDFDVGIVLEFFDMEGKRLDKEGLHLMVKANTKQDFLLHELSKLAGISLSSNSYGSIRINSNSMLNYNMSMYELKGDSFLPENVLTSFQVPSSFPITGVSYVADNTFVPGSHGGINAKSGELDSARVLSWLTLFNASEEKCNFNIASHDQFGAEIGQRSFDVVPMQRLDVQGLSVQDRVGLHKISATNKKGESCLYQGYLNRLGVEADGAFRFSIFAPARVGTNNSILSFRMPKSDSAVWVELSNLSTNKVLKPIKLLIYSQNGLLIDSKVINLNSLEQAHFPLHELLKEGEFGQVQAQGLDESTSQISLSLMYYESSSNGKITAYASHATSLASKVANGYANTFIGQGNTVLLSNANSSENIGSIQIQATGQSITKAFSPFETISVDVNKYMSPDTYSAYKVRGTEPLLVQSFTDSSAKTYSLPNQGLPLAAQAGDNAFDPIDIDIDNPSPPPFNSVFDECIDQLEDQMAQELANQENDAAGECISGCVYAVAYAWARCSASAFAYCPMGPWATKWEWKDQDQCNYAFQCAKLCIQDEFEPPPLCDFDPDRPTA